MNALQKVLLVSIGLIAGIVLMPLLPFVVAAMAWHEFDKGEYAEEER